MYLVQSTRTSETPARVVSRRSLVQKTLSARERAAIAASVLAGEVVLTLSVSQLAAVIGTHATCISVASQLTPEMRQAIANGKSDLAFSPLLKASPKSSALPQPVGDIINAAALDALIIRATKVEHALARAVEQIATA